MIRTLRTLALCTGLVFSGMHAEESTTLNKFRENLRDGFQKAAEYINTLKPTEGTVNPFDGEMLQATLDVVKDGVQAVAAELAETSKSVANEVVETGKTIIGVANEAISTTETVKKATEETAGVVVETGKKTWQEMIGQEKANAVLETLKKNFEQAQVWTVEHKELVAVGAVALVTVGGASFFLYKSGKLVPFSKAVNNHPYLTAGAIVSVLGIGAVAWYAYTHPDELQKLLNYRFN